MSFAGKIVNRIQMMFSKALTKSTDDSNAMQLVKISLQSGEVQDGIERVQNYGMSSVPPNESEAVAAYLNGNRDHGVVIACDNAASRITGLGDGEVVVYSKHGQKILLKADGSIEITAPETSVGNGSDFVAMAAKVNFMFDLIDGIITGWTPAAPDGGAALKTAWTTLYPTAKQDVSSTNLKAD